MVKLWQSACRFNIRCRESIGSRALRKADSESPSLSYVDDSYHHDDGCSNYPFENSIFDAHDGLVVCFRLLDVLARPSTILNSVFLSCSHLFLTAKCFSSIYP